VLNGRKWGSPKGTFHYMKQNTKNDKLFTLNAYVSERLRDCNAKKAL